MLTIVILTFSAIKTSKFQIEFLNTKFNLNTSIITGLLEMKQIEELEKNVSNTEVEKEEKILNSDSKIILSLVIFGKIKIYKKDITKIKLKDVGKKIDLKLINKNDKFNIKFRNLIDDLKMDIEKLDLKVEVGTENAMVTAFLVAGISSFLSIILREQIKYTEGQKFIVLPRYVDELFLKIDVTGIFQIDLLHYIKRKRDDKYERTSNRRTYDYSYE